ncbi:hypothetical protein D9M72_536780 [compost metagenome]
MAQAIARDGEDFVAPREGVALVVEAGQLGRLDHLCQRRHLRERQRQEAILRSEHAVRRADVHVRMRLGRALLRLAGHAEDRQLLHLQRDDGVEHVHLHQLTLAGALAVQQRGNHGLEGGRGRDGIHQVLARGCGRLAGAAGRQHRAAHGLQQQVLAGPELVGAVFAVARHRHVDQLRVDLRERLVVHAQALRHAGAVVLQEHVGRAHQLVERVAALLVLQVDG